jgi:hypothetical protein
MREQVDELEQINSVIVTGPADIQSKYGGIFFYGIHMVERMFKLFGDDVAAASRISSHFPVQVPFRMPGDRPDRSELEGLL